MPISESQKRANEKYMQNVKKLNANIDNNIYALMEEYCKQYDITKRKFIEDAIMEYLDKH